MDRIRTSKLRSALKPSALALAACFVVSQPCAANVYDILEGMSTNSWQRLNVNNFLDAAPPANERGGAASGYNAAASVIYAWGSFAWDSKRSELLIFGGGHHNYTGNEMYKWSATTMEWSLASLPSQMTPIPGVGTTTPNWAPVDGAMNAPVSAHTYDNNNYLAGIDRFITLGGGSAHSGGQFTVQVDANTSRVTGPYLFDPSKADPNKVGGTDGSGVLPGSVGGQMWQNRDVAAMHPYSFVNGTSAAAVENGKDVLYFTARAGGTSDTRLYRMTIADVNNPASDVVEQVGTNFIGGQPQAPNAAGSAAYDPASRLYVALGEGIAGKRFVAWDMDTAGPNVGIGFAPTLLSGEDIPYAGVEGIDFDPTRGVFMLWSNGGSVWELAAPTGGTATGQWTLKQVADDDSFAANAAPADRFSAGGTRGKWHYASDLDAFVALEDNADGNVWVFKPEGWVNPSPVPEAPTWLLLAAGLTTLVLRRRKH